MAPSPSEAPGAPPGGEPPSPPDPPASHDQASAEPPLARLLDGAMQAVMLVLGIVLLLFIARADIGRDETELYKIPLAAVGGLLALAWPLLAAWQRIRYQALVLLVVISGANYERWGFSAATERLDAYDLLHYYINTKYFDQLGYFDLYPAILVVDHDNGGPFFQEGYSYLAQDASGHHLEPIRSGLQRGEIVRQRFSEEEWRAFEHDVLYLQRTVGCTIRSRKTQRCVRELNDELWRQLINDHGFNGTPAWTLLARPLTVFPVESVKLLGYVDVVLLAAALGLVGSAYGGATALWAALFLFLTYSTRWPYFSWVLLRYDWVAMLLASTSLLKLGRPWLAGAAAGGAATLRLFPALFMWGPFAKGVFGLFERRVSRPLLALAGGFLIAAAVLQGGAMLRFGPHAVTDHFENMLDHNRAEQLSSRRIGMALALATEPWLGTSSEPVISAERKDRIDHQRPLRYGAGLALMLLLGYALRRRGDDEAYAYGFLPFFLLTTASYYYYVARIPLVVVHACDLDRLRNRVCLAALFAMEVFSNAAATFVPEHRLFLIATLAWALLLYAILAVGWMLFEPPTARSEP